MNTIDLLLESKNPNDVYSVLIDIGKQGLYEYEEKVWKLLEHEEEEVRRGAVMVLSTYWSRREFISKAHEIWNNDPDELVCVTALIGWFAYFHNTSDKSILNELNQVLRDESLDFDLRKEAFRGIFVVKGLAVPESVIDRLDFVYTKEDFHDRIPWEELDEMFRED